MISTAACILSISLFLTEGFESVSYFPPDHWIPVNADAYDAYWVSTGEKTHSGTTAAACGADFNSQNNDYLITPQVMPRLETGDTLAGFWVSTAGAGTCSLDIMISTAAVPRPSGFSRLVTVDVSPSWQHRGVSLSELSSIPLYLAFRTRNLPVGQKIYVDDVSLPAATIQPTFCNGLLRTTGDPAQQRLLAWGTHEEMGFAHGFLLGEQCLANMNRFVVGTSMFHWWTPYEYENDILPYFRTYFSIPAKYQDEAAGLLAGIQAKGLDIYHAALERDVTVEDILCGNALGDFQGFNCSSNSGWGESTAADDTLQGGLVIARNFEFPTGQNATLGNTSLIIAFDPTEEDEQRVAAVTFAGYFGCTSMMNEHGVAALIDNGNYAYAGTIKPGSLVPFGLSLRNALEDGETTDVFNTASRIDPTTSRYAYDIHLVSPFDDSHPVPAVILELNNLADSLRSASNNNLEPAIDSASNLVVTNHHRVLYPPVYCERYAALACSLNANPFIDTARALRLQDSIGWWVGSYLMGTLHSIAMRPNVLVEHPSWPCILVSYADRGGGAHMHPRRWYSWDELFWRDVQAPGTITDLTVTPVGNDLVLTWSDPGDDTGVIEYRIYRSAAPYFEPNLSVLFSSTAAGLWSDEGALPTTGGLFYRVAARDGSLNEGIPSPPEGALSFSVVLR